jgi:hypothetical protein
LGFRGREALLTAVAVLLVASAAPASAATYYVDASQGNDSNPGTAQKPWKTIDQVRQSSSSGDTIHIVAWNASLSDAKWPGNRLYSAKAVHQHGITWTFAAEYRVGQFANGDFWVVGPVSVEGISPASAVVDGSTRNGSMINPVSNLSQGFDSRASHWNTDLCVGIGVSRSNPLVVPGGSSLISTKSLGTYTDGSYLDSAAILTVLVQAPEAGSFRPSYFGTDKTIRYNVSDLDYDVLGTLDANDVGVSGTVPNLSTVAGYFQRPWVSFVANWGGRNVHPINNMKPYGRDRSVQTGIGGLLLQLNFTNKQKETLLTRYTQVGIDWYGVASHPGGRTTWIANGGHCMGHKFPILFAGTVLGDNNMIALMQKSGAYLWSAKPGGGNYGPGDIPPDYIYFQEDMQTFYVDRFMVDLPLVTSVSGYAIGATTNTITIDNLPQWSGQPEHQYVEITAGPGAGQTRYITSSNYNRSTGGVTTVTVSENWTTTPTTGSQYRLRGYESEWIGRAEWGINHATNPARTFPSWGADYRYINGVAYPGWTLAAWIMNLKPAWNHDALFDYVDRWMDETSDEGQYTVANRTNSTFVEAMWERYRGSCGPAGPGGLTGHRDGSADEDPPDTHAPQITAIGDQAVSPSRTLGFHVAENESLTLAVSATDPDGDTITYSATGLPSGASFSGRTFRWTPAHGQAGSYQVTFVASDGQNQDSATVTITVVKVNRAPVLGEIDDRFIDQDQSLAFPLAASDPDGDSLTYSASGLPAGASLTGGSFSWTPSASHVGSHNITFVVSDGDLQDRQSMTIVVAGTGPDSTAPTVARRAPEPEAIQVSLNNLVTLHVTDGGRGVNSESVVIRVDDTIVYQGDVSVYESANGRCSRSGMPNDYRFIYQANEPFAFDHTVRVTVNAADRAGNGMSTHAYSFTTEMRAFGSNWAVSGGFGVSGPKSRPATVSNAAGTVWTVWCSGAEGQQDLYVSRMPAGADGFEPPVAITTASGDQRHPGIAQDADGALYVVWQDRQRGNWDIFMAVSTNGTTWSRPIQITDSDGNETQPAIAADIRSPSRVYIAWQDDRDGNADIFVASSTNAFSDSQISRLTTDLADQLSPAVAVGADDIVYIVWTDMRRGQTDLYGAWSGASDWPNTPLVTTDSGQSSPAVAFCEDSSLLHLLWVDDARGHKDIYHAALDGWPAQPVAGRSIIDDTSGADQLSPAIVSAAGSRVFACWQDRRHTGRRSADTDLFVAELGPDAAGTNIFVGDDRTNSGQSEPAIGIDGYANPYLVWTDARGSSTEIYFTATTFLDPTPLDARQVVASVGATVGTDPAAIAQPDDVSIVVPPRACRSDARISISRILNPPVAPADCLGSYDFGPSGIDFAIPVTVTIPYRFSGTGGSAKPYWYDSLTGALTQYGITDIENLVIAPNLNALRFKTTHFTPFYIVADTSPLVEGDSDGSGGSGGCSISTAGGGSPKDLLVPYAVLAIAVVAFRRKDRRRRHSFETVHE